MRMLKNLYTERPKEGGGKEFLDEEMPNIDLIHQDTIGMRGKKKGISIVFLHCIHLWIQLLVSHPAEGHWD